MIPSRWLCRRTPRHALVTVPADFEKALAKNKKAKAAFERFSYSHQKEFVGYIDEAKKPETRARRIANAPATLLAEKNSKV